MYIDAEWTSERGLAGITSESRESKQQAQSGQIDKDEGAGLVSEGREAKGFSVPLSSSRQREGKGRVMSSLQGEMSVERREWDDVRCEKGGQAISR